MYRTRRYYFVRGVVRFVFWTSLMIAVGLYMGMMWLGVSGAGIR